MFTWICPKCGREVPPAYNECPDCTAQTAGPPAEAVSTAQPAAAPPPPKTPEPQPERPAFAAASPAVSRPPVRRASTLSMPTWLMAILFAMSFAVLVGGAYWFLGGRSDRTHAAPAAAVENPAAKPGAPVSPYQKFIEISGVRFVEDPKNKQRTMVKFILTNHSEADIPGLAGNVTIWGRTRQSEEDAQGSFAFQSNIGPFESKELTAPLNTKLKIYELGDWQNLTNDLQITAPGTAVSQGSGAPR